MSVETAGNGSRSFEQRFQVEKMRPFGVFGGSLEVVDIAPEVPNPSKLRPVLIAPGWSANPDVYKGPIKALESKGRHVLSLSHTRYGRSIDTMYEKLVTKTKSNLAAGGMSEVKLAEKGVDFEARWNFLLNNYPTATLRRALNILGMLEEKGIEKTDVIAHSEGGIDIAVATYLNPDKIGNIVPLESAGLMGHDSPYRIAKGNLQQGKIESKQNPSLPHDGTDTQLIQDIEQMAKDSLSPKEGKRNLLRYVRRNPIRAIAEVIALADPIEYLLKEARENGSGVLPIHAVDDPVFPMGEVQRRGALYTDAYSKDGKGTVDGFLSIQGNHSTFLADPRVALLADYALTQLAKIYH